MPQLIEAKAQLKKLDNTIAALSNRAYRDYYITLEIMIARYQQQMRALLATYEPKLLSRQGDAVHIKLALDSFGADLHRIAEPTLTAAANVGFQRCLTDLQLHGKVRKFSTPVIAPHSLSVEAIAANLVYVRTSLLPDMTKRLNKAQTPAEMLQAIAAFNARLDMYAHWVWRTSELAYALGLKDFEALRKQRKAMRA